jgi:hypothetical protein
MSNSKRPIIIKNNQYGGDNESIEYAKSLQEDMENSLIVLSRLYGKDSELYKLMITKLNKIKDDILNNNK